ncbi:glycosyltransferase family 32 protein [Flavobacterium sp.]|jgi:mannosyltransferase OCH1-like enzyme|uniref:glycosyltransferase family 32 protein n=1 Tax=Flavobacterium sp. TaxID=239 RepID=UPI0035B1CBB3
MIPKTIHYCWFGGNPLPQLAQDCIASWKKYLPDYELVEWNEKNFPFEKFPFAQEALDNRKFAFVSDVCRLYALKEYGGIYMDTDVEVLKSLDIFLHHAAFSGFENDDYVPTGIMASEKNSQWATDLLKYYDNRSFIKENGELDIQSNTYIITEMMKEKGFVMNNKFQEIEDYVAFYPNDYFCPKSYKTGSIDLTKNSYCIHHFAKSWIPLKYKWRNIIKLKMIKLFGYNNIEKIVSLFK